MRGRRSPLAIELTKTERVELERIARARTAPSGKVERVRIVLKFVAGETLSAIAREMELERRTVRKWIKRFARQRFQGLDDLPRAGRPPAFPPGGRVARRQDRVRTA